MPRVYILAFMLSSALAGIAGALLAPVQSVYVTVGGDVIINAFIVVVALMRTHVGGIATFVYAGLARLGARHKVAPSS